MRGLQRPPDRGFADLIRAGQLGHGLASGVPFGDLALLASIEGAGAAELLAVGEQPVGRDIYQPRRLAGFGTIPADSARPEDNRPEQAGRSQAATAKAECRATTRGI